jgi:hypothetical protein
MNDRLPVLGQIMRAHAMAHRPSAALVTVSRPVRPSYLSLAVKLAPDSEEAKRAKEALARLQ